MEKTEILTQEFINSYKNKKVNWGFDGLGYIVYKRTYARRKKDGSTEEWYETIGRCINGAQKIGARYTKKEAEELYDLMFNLKCSYPGRMLWQLGTNTVDRFGGNSLLNCWFVSIRNIEDFCFIFENLMLGGGVGFSVRREDIHELPKVKKDVVIQHELTKDADFIVPDSREGWISLVRQVFQAYFNGGKSFTYSTILVRGAGEPISGFGGVASGPTILVEGIEKICNIISSREGKKLRSIDVLDICNIIGSIVVSGNVRRSAEIAIGDPDDYLYIRAKRWDTGTIPNHRAMSNNSLYIDGYDHITSEVWEGYMGNGEPYGFINLPLIQKNGRLGDSIKDNCEGINPCGEIPLASYECCNLSELFLNRIESKEELIKCATLLYKTQKAVASLNFLHEETNKIVHKNMRLGLGVTGICQAIDKIEWLDDTYKALRKLDRHWSEQRGWNESIKLTTVKPSGTVSLLAGATPGIHPAYSQYYIRTIRMSSNDPLVNYCRSMGYHVEYALKFDKTEDRNIVVVSFPCDAGTNTLLAKDVTAVKQLELVKKLQTVWADNAVSATVYYRKEELPQIKAWLEEHYETGIKSVSFLLHKDHNFAQAPYQEILMETYDQLLAGLKPIVHNIDLGSEDLDVQACSGGVCPIK